MTRGVAAALVVWTALAAAWGVFLWAGHVVSCLGGPGITVDDCRAASGLAPETDLDRFIAGPAVPVLVLVIGWVTILLVARWRKRQRSRD